ncbi:MAG: hypothetical protein KY476_21735, partial [Planctomycetes bacterium]|nr:hypothetical protein [Planctomycetota bacterium]
MATDPRNPHDDPQSNPAASGGPDAAPETSDADWDEAESVKTFAIDGDLSPDVVKTMDAAWLGAFDSRTHSGQTVKGHTAEEQQSILASFASQTTWDERVVPPTSPDEDFGDNLQTIPEAAASKTVPTTRAPQPKPEPDEASEDTEDSIEKTFISDEFAPVDDENAATMPETPDLARGTEDESDKTIVIPEGQEDSVDKTFISDEFQPVDADDDGGATHPGTLAEAAESADSVEQTLISDSHDPSRLETMDSGSRGIPASQTSADDATMVFEREEDTGLVIKVRHFRHEDGRGPKDAEYNINRVLGEGGMGTVYDAVQTAINRSVALKMLKKPKQAKTAQQLVSARQKFLAEAVVTGDLDHPNIV